MEALVNILAQVSRSDFPCNTNRLIPRMSPQSRRLIYEVLLAVVEKIPSRVPIINDGWGRWFHDRALSHEHWEQVKAGRVLEKTYFDSPQAKALRDSMRKKVQTPLAASSIPK